MKETSFTINKEELLKLIEDAVYNATCTLPNLEYNFITEKELSKRVGISKVTLGKYRKEGKIPFSKIQPEEVIEPMADDDISRL